MSIFRRILGNILKNQNYKYQTTLSNFYISRKYSTSYDINLNINGVSLNKILLNLTQEYDKIKQSGPKERIAKLKPIVDMLDKRNELTNNIEQLGELLKERDNDLKQLAEEEQKNLEDKISKVDKQLEEAILHVSDPERCDSIVVEVNAGVGGQEAMLFAKELFEMYCGFVSHKGWSHEIAEYAITELGGVRHATMLVEGHNCFQFFKYEAGVHRVQRIPTTEKSGRIHTSTVSVLAIPQPTEIEIEIQSKDLIIETKKSSGAGGQHVNTTDSAVRITHVPTGISVESQVDRSQIKNRRFAMQRLRAKIYQMELEKQLNEISEKRKSQVKSNFRNEKIRTYNFSQDRITDHRLQSSNVHNLKYFMEGNEMLESLINKLHVNDQVEQLLNSINEK